MKVSSTVSLRSDDQSVEAVKQCVDALLKSAIEKARETNQLSVFESALLVYMGLLKVINYLT